MFGETMLIETVGRWNVVGHMWIFVQNIIIGSLFVLLQMVVAMIAFILDLLDFGSGILAMRRTFFNHSSQLFNNFIGGSRGNVNENSIFYMMMLISVIYLAYQYFLGKGSFSQKVMHILLVLMTSFIWFGSITTTTGASHRGGEYIMQTVDNFVATFEDGLIDLSTGDGLNEAGFADYYRDHVIATTFNFINSGTTDGCYAPNSCLDRDKLVPADGLSSSEMLDFEEERQDYVDEMASDNPFVRANGSVFVLRLMGVILGFFNAIILAIPIVFARLATVALRLLSNIILLFIPFAVVISFIPLLSNVLFKMIKTLLGLSLFPALLSFLVIIIFYVNNLIDGLILGAMTGILEATNGVPIAGAIGASVASLLVLVTSVAVKYYLLRAAWSSKAALLGFITGGVVKSDVIEKPEAYIKEHGVEVADRAIGVAEIEVGLLTNNPDLVKQGINHVRHGRDEEKEEKTNKEVDVEKDEINKEEEQEEKTDKEVDVEKDEINKEEEQAEKTDKEVDVEKDVNEQQEATDDEQPLNESEVELEEAKEKPLNESEVELGEAKEEPSNESEVELEDIEEVFKDLDKNMERRFIEEMEMLDDKEFSAETILNGVPLESHDLNIPLNDGHIKEGEKQSFEATDSPDVQTSRTKLNGKSIAVKSNSPTDEFDYNTLPVDDYNFDNEETKIFDYLKSKDASEKTRKQEKQTNNFVNHLKNLRND